MFTSFPAATPGQAQCLRCIQLCTVFPTNRICINAARLKACTSTGSLNLRQAFCKAYFLIRGSNRKRFPPHCQHTGFFNKVFACLLFARVGRGFAKFRLKTQSAIPLLFAQMDGKKWIVAVRWDALLSCFLDLFHGNVASRLVGDAVTWTGFDVYLFSTARAFGSPMGAEADFT